MKKYSVKLNQRAFRDIDDIFNYIAIEISSPATAKKQTDRIWKALKSLEKFPYAHQDRIDGKYANKGYKQLLIDKYMAIYRINENDKKVYIITVIYQGCNV